MARTAITSEDGALLDKELRHRARRLLAGDHRIEDLDRLFLGLRGRAGNRDCFREIGDFVAHRDVREKGLVTQVGRDVFTSVNVWSFALRGIRPSLDDIADAANANFRLASDEQLKAGCGCSRPAARSRLQSALTKVRQNQRLTRAEEKVFLYLGNCAIWRPAFTSDQLFTEFRDVLTQNAVIDAADFNTLDDARTFLSLYALTLMHGSAIILDSGKKAGLFAGFANRDRRLEVKIDIVFNDLSKPVMAPICLFLTNLCPDDHCEPSLIVPAIQTLADHWNFPIEIGTNGKIAHVG